MYRVLFLILAIYLVSGCTSTSKDAYIETNRLHPPQFKLPDDKDSESVKIFLQGLLQENEPSTRWWARYKLAQHLSQSAPDESCLHFKKLEKDVKFPLREVAQLHRLTICPDMDHLDEEIISLKKEEKPWLDKLKLDVQIQLAEKSNDPKNKIEAYLEKSKLNLPRNLKVDYTLKAYREARKFKLDSRFSLRKRLHKLAPRYIYKPKPKDYLKVAYDFRRVRDFKKAVHYYTKATKTKSLDFSTKLLAYKGLSKTYKLIDDKKLYIHFTKKAKEFAERPFLKRPHYKSNANLMLENSLTLARAYWTLGQIKNARRILKQADKRLAGRISRHKIYWIYGRMAEERGHFKSALFWFDKALDEDFKSTEFRESISWYKAWNLRKSKRFADSNIVLNEIIENSENNYALPRYKFWKAKNLENLNQFDESKLVFADLRKDDPLGFYGLLAHKETHEVLDAISTKRKPATVNFNKDRLRLSKYAPVTPLEWLISLDEGLLSQLYLDQISQEIRKAQNKNIGEDFQQDWLALFHYYAKAGEYLSLFTQLGQLGAEERKSILAKNPHLIFPRPFDDHVQESAQRFGISAEFIYSIMRQESAFNPRARSHMDAFGLMQLLPRNARKSARKNNIEFSKPEDLFEPHVSIPLGAAFLRDLWDKYEGKLILATASYNANDRAIRSWMKTRFRGDSLEFIEDIPYEETRNYVKLVLRNLVFYKLFNSSNRMIAFPDWALTL